MGTPELSGTRSFASAIMRCGPIQFRWIGSQEYPQEPTRCPPRGRFVNEVTWEGVGRETSPVFVLTSTDESVTRTAASPVASTVAGAKELEVIESLRDVPETRSTRCNWPELGTSVTWLPDLR